MNLVKKNIKHEIISLLNKLIYFYTSVKPDSHNLLIKKNITRDQSLSIFF